MGSTSVTRCCAVIPVWDDFVALLPEAVESLRTDADEAWEIVVVDNCSDVEVPSLAGTTVLRTPRRMTIGGARNWALRQVETDLFMFWDADDRVLPGTLGLLRTTLAANPGAVAAVCSWRAWDADSGRTSDWGFPKPWAVRIARWPSLLAASALFLNPYPVTGATLFRAAAVRGLDPCLDANYGEDWALALALALRGRVVMLEHAGRLYRIHSGSLTTGEQPRATLYDTTAAAVRDAARSDPARPWWLPPVAATAALYHRFKHRRVRAQVSDTYDDFQSADAP